ncbi:mucoidy inhibitor MuiA family protein [Streptomyces sp. NBC_01477]|uniref:mucoidy inhibitor MuiA family protein n=1 Tax=Streptomyces sp. NBC_01477 TaxID=2976015 RepID=UPI002E313FF2|nr:mucoidy inhibitor MuiA family protein [Streptomyces sp. NBC_01477]
MDDTFHFPEADAEAAPGADGSAGSGAADGLGGLPGLTALPITAVTCMEDRAQVERAGSVALTAGVGRLRIGPVTPLTADRSLRADFAAGAGARVVDARVVRTYTPAPPGEPGQDASGLRREVHELEQEMADAKLLRQRVESALAVVGQARTDLHRDIVQGAGGGDADPERWADRLDRVEQEAEPRIGELHKLRRRLHDLDEELREAREALAAVETEPQQLTAYLDLVVEAERDGSAELRVTGLVPCALWRPAYRATLAADRRSVRVETDAFVWQETGEDWSAVRLTLSTARPTLAASPPVLADDVLTLRERSVEERRTVEVNLREEEIRTVGGASPAAPAGLPGLHDGGDVRVLAAPHPVSVPSDHRPHRVHVTSFTAPCTVENTCAPELSPLVVATARLTNTSGHVLLAGPVDLVRGSGFVGRGRLEFAGAGEEFEVAFGSEDTFRVVRHTEETRDTTGLAAINQRTVLTRRVRLFVSRLDSRPGAPEHEITVRERVPVSEVSAVEVELRTADCRPQPDSLDAEGIARYALRLAPGDHREIELVYDITAASSVTGL